MPIKKKKTLKIYYASVSFQISASIKHTICLTCTSYTCPSLQERYSAHEVDGNNMIMQPSAWNFGITAFQEHHLCHQWFCSLILYRKERISDWKWRKIFFVCFKDSYKLSWQEEWWRHKTVSSADGSDNNCLPKFMQFQVDQNMNLQFKKFYLVLFPKFITLNICKCSFWIQAQIFLIIKDLHNLH